MPEKLSVDLSPTLVFRDEAPVVAGERNFDRNRHCCVGGGGEQSKGKGKQESVKRAILLLGGQCDLRSFGCVRCGSPSFRDQRKGS